MGAIWGGGGGGGGKRRGGIGGDDCTKLFRVQRSKYQAVKGITVQNTAVPSYPINALTFAAVL